MTLCLKRTATTRQEVRGETKHQTALDHHTIQISKVAKSLYIFILIFHSFQEVLAPLPGHSCVLRTQVAARLGEMDTALTMEDMSIALWLMLRLSSRG